MEIFLIRHTKVAIEKSVCYGNSDIELAHSFQEELECLKQKLSDAESYVIYSSPLSRCLKLARELNPAQDPFTDDRLKELNFGDWELQSWDAIAGDELNRWMNDYVNVACPGGESYIDLFNRCADFLSDLQKSKHEKVLIITHGGVIRSLLCLILNIPLNKSFSLQIDYGNISKIRCTGEKEYIVEYVNH